MTISYWLTDSRDDATPRPSLDGSRDVDVVIVAAGFTGLWTARELLRRDPSRSVLVCEADTAGFGASGRNGAWLSAGIAVSPDELARRTSPAIACDTILAMRDTVDRVIAACAEDGIDAQVRHGGILRLARGPQELPAMTAGLRQLQMIGADDGVRLLSRQETADRVRVTGALGSLHDPYAAAIHPGRMVSGLARAFETAGGEIVERTPVTEVLPAVPGRRARVRTAMGEVTADAVIVACEAWVSQLPRRRRDVLPLYSLIVLAEPLRDDVWDQIGWSSHDLLRDQLRTWFPPLAGVRLDHAWGGPVAMPRDWMPNIHVDPATGNGGAYGHAGQDVGTSNLAGRILADLIVDGDTPMRDLPMVGHRSRRWEPEPLRWLGARYLQDALRRLDARSPERGAPPTGRSLAERLLRH